MTSIADSFSRHTIGHTQNSAATRLLPPALLQAPALAGARAADLHDRVVFGGNRPLVRETHVAGQRVVAEGRHRDGEAIAARYRRVLADLLA